MSWRAMNRYNPSQLCSTYTSLGVLISSDICPFLSCLSFSCFVFLSFKPHPLPIPSCHEMHPTACGPSSLPPYLPINPLSYNLTITQHHSLQNLFKCKILGKQTHISNLPYLTECRMHVTLLLLAVAGGDLLESISKETSLQAVL